MARTDIPEGIYAALTGSSALLAVLGSASAGNQRVYRGWPQTQPTLVAESPHNTGWMVYMLTPGESTYGEATETLDLECSILGTRWTLGEAAQDVLDTIWDWRVPQEQSLQYGTWIVYMARRVGQVQRYDEERKLYIHTSRYRLRCIEETT